MRCGSSSPLVEAKQLPWRAGWGFLVSFDWTLNLLLLNTCALCLLALCFWVWHHLSPESALSPETLFLSCNFGIVLKLRRCWRPACLPGITELTPSPDDGVSLFSRTRRFKLRMKRGDLYSETMIEPKLEPRSLYFQTSVVSGIHAPCPLLCRSLIISSNLKLPLGS